MRATCRGTRAVRLRKAERGNYSKRPDAVSEARRGPGQNVEVGLPPHTRALLRALSVGAAQGWRKGALASLGCRPPPAVVSTQGRRLQPRGQVGSSGARPGRGHQKDTLRPL